MLRPVPLRRHLLALIAPLAPGDDVLPGVRVLAASSELGLRLRLDAGGTPLDIEIAPYEDGMRCAARSARLAFSYRAGSDARGVDPALGQRVCVAIAEIAARNENAVLEELARESSGAGEAAARIREVTAPSLLDPFGEGRARGYGLSPYVGCVIGCRFCYAQSPLRAARRLAGAPDVRWGSWVDVRADAPEVLARELELLEPRPIKLCPIVSDPYQAIESRALLTRRCLETIGRATRTWPALVLTRSELVLRDADVLASLPIAMAGVSLPTADDETRRHFEPRAATVGARARVLRELRESGVPTFAVVQPILAGSIDRLADLLAGTVTSVSLGVLRGEEGAASDFDDPRYAHTRTDAWQADRRAELEAALAQRGIRVWEGELPPELVGWADQAFG